ncbi:MAG: VWA domain-containing protein [Bryobacteraceae bacterium]
MSVKPLILALFLGIGVSLLPGTPAGGQARSGQVPSTPPPIPTLQANVREVLVPVLVTDKKGHPVSNLQRSDFAVFEDGVPQHIVAFNKTYSASLNPSTRPARGGSANESSRAALGSHTGSNSPIRNYVICVDTLHSNLGDVVRAQRTLKKFFQHEHDPKAQYALMILGRNIEVIQDATRDPSAILSALKSKKFETGVADGEASGIESEEQHLMRMLTGASPRACAGRNACTELKGRVRSYIDKSANRTALLTRDFLRELKAIISAMGGMPTQRTLILISDGFNLAPGEELYGIASAYFPGDAEWRINVRYTQPMLNEILQMAENDNVVVYGLDSRGAYTPASSELLGASNGVMDGHGAGMDSRNTSFQASVQAVQTMTTNEAAVAWQNGSALAQFASATGGIYFENSNNLLPGLRRAFNDERVRYLIAYSPSNNAADGQYRKIGVTVKRKGLRVYAKSGYWAPANPVASRSTK